MVRSSDMSFIFNSNDDIKEIAFEVVLTHDAIGMRRKKELITFTISAERNKEEEEKEEKD